MGYLVGEVKENQPPNAHLNTRIKFLKKRDIVAMRAKINLRSLLAGGMYGVTP